MSGLLAQIGERVVPLAECDWIMRAPCGCVSGVTVVTLPRDDASRMVATEDQAWSAFYDTAGFIERSKSRGFTLELIAHDSFREMVGSLNCEHTPKWGVPERPSADGYGWAVGDYQPTARSRMHLVPLDHIGDDFDAYKARNWEKAAALCGAKAYPWRADREAWGEHLDCTRCEKKASTS